MAAPTWQAIGAVAESATADVSPAWPTHQAGDIGVLVVGGYDALSRLSVPAGFQEFPCSPQRLKIGSSTDTHMTLYWKRATGAAESAPTVKWTVDYLRAQIFTIRGCSAVGRPFTTAKGKDAASSTAVTFPSLTTTDADQLIVDIIKHTLDTTGAKLSGWANASLTGLTERVDDSGTLGSGGGYAINTGVKATAGVVNATTATLASASLQVAYSIAFTSVEQPTDKMPYLKAYGDPVQSASAAVTPVWPAHVAGDIGILFVESGGWPVTLGTPAGFAEVPNSPQNGGVSGQSAASQLSVYWCRATSGAMANPTVNFTSEHVRAMIVTVGNNISAGDPVDVSSGNGTGGGSTTTSYSVPGATTTAPNVFVMAFGTNSRAVINRHEWTAWANADLNYLTERYDDTAFIGGGSGFAFATGEKAAAGAFGATTSTLDAASHQGRVMIGLKGPTGGGVEFEKGIFTLTGMAIDLLHDRVIGADPGVYTLVGFAADFPIVKTFILDAEPGEFSSVGFGTILTKSSRGWRKQQGRTPTVWTKQSQLDLED